MNLIYELSVKEAKPLPDFTGSDAYSVKLTLDGQVIHTNMLAMFKKMDEKLIDEMTTDDYILLSTLFQKRDDADISHDRFANLLKLGIVRETELGMELVEGKLIVVVDENDKASVSSSVSQALATNARDTLELNDRHKQILAFMANNAKVTTAQLQNQLGLSDGRIRKLLIELAKKNLIRKVGDNRYAHYVLINTDE